MVPKKKKKKKKNVYTKIHISLHRKVLGKRFHGKLHDLNLQCLLYTFLRFYVRICLLSQCLVIPSSYTDILSSQFK